MNVGKRTPAPSWILPIDRIVTSCVKGYWQFPDAKCITTTFSCTKDGFWRVNGCSNTDCSPLGKYTCTSTGTVLSTWSGCVGARSVISYNPANFGLNRSDDTYLGTIADPTVRPYSGQSDESVRYGDCPANQIMAMTSDKSAALKLISELKPGGNTYIPTGLIWGWNVLAPAEPYVARTAEQLASLGGRKVMVLMTDGVNTASPRLNEGFYYRNGDTRIPPVWRDGSKSNELISTICESIKKDDIVIATVLYDAVDDANIERILSRCATPGLFYRAADNEALLRAFEDIGDRFKLLKLTQ